MPNERIAAKCFTAVSAVLAGSLLLSACAAGKTAADIRPHPEIRDPRRLSHDELSVYVPAWLDEGTCDTLSKSLPPKATRLILAFASIKRDGSVAAPDFSPACQRMVRNLGRNAALSLAVGGYGGSEAEHEKILAGWSAALKNPVRFAGTAVLALQSLGNRLGQDITGLDFDFEYPEASQGADVRNLIQTVRQALPHAELSMAVPAEKFSLAAGQLVQELDHINVMTYDQHGPWSKRAGIIADRAWVVKSVKKWVEKVGDPGKIMVGYPAYGYKYVNAERAGDTFDRTATKHADPVQLRDIPEESIISDNRSGTSYALIDGSWTSIVTPVDAARTQAFIRKEYPGIGGMMFWSIEGMTPESFKTDR